MPQKQKISAEKKGQVGFGLFGKIKSAYKKQLGVQA